MARHSRPLTAFALAFALTGRSSSRTLAIPSSAARTARAPRFRRERLDWFWSMAMQASIKGTLDCIKAFSETDFTADLRKFDRPTLTIHGDDDKIVPIGAAGRSRLRKFDQNTILKVYPGAPHGLTITRKNEVNADMFRFSRTLGLGAMSSDAAPLRRRAAHGRRLEHGPDTCALVFRLRSRRTTRSLTRASQVNSGNRQ